MPQRAFVTASFDDLTAANTGIIATLEKAQKSGGVHSLRNNNTGFLTQVNIQTNADIDRRYTQARYEAYLRVKALLDTDPTKAGLLLIWTNPYQERVMRVEVNRSGYCFPITP